MSLAVLSGWLVVLTVAGLFFCQRAACSELGQSVLSVDEQPTLSFKNPAEPTNQLKRSSSVFGQLQSAVYGHNTDIHLPAGLQAVYTLGVLSRETSDTLLNLHNTHQFISLTYCTGRYTTRHRMKNCPCYITGIYIISRTSHVRAGPVNNQRLLIFYSS